jgi:hypothetical protein
MWFLSTVVLAFSINYPFKKIFTYVYFILTIPCHPVPPPDGLEKFRVFNNWCGQKFCASGVLKD